MRLGDDPRASTNVFSNSQPFYVKVQTTEYSVKLGVAEQRQVSPGGCTERGRLQYIEKPLSPKQSVHDGSTHAAGTGTL